MDRRRIASAGAVIMVGTLTASVLGFVRAFVIARTFGAGPQTNALFAALIVPQMFYDQLIGGAIAAVLIPTFSRLAAEDEKELWRVVGSIFALVLAVLSVAVLVLELAAYPLMALIVSGFVHKQGIVPLAVHLVRLLLPALVFMGLSGVAVATLYSLQRRAVAAFAPSWFHLGIIVATLVAADRWGIAALPVGAVVGAALQFGVQLPSILRAHTLSGVRTLRLRLNLPHPVVQRILRLYLPVAGGIVVSIVGQVVDYNFKSHLPQADGLSVMQYATQIIQFPVGIIALALGMAVLPAISTDAAAQRARDFKETLDLGFRLVLVLMVPAMVGLFVLATPIVSLLFQRGQFSHLNTIHTATALLGYAPQLPFIGIDQLLIFAFYARHDTLTPALVGVVGVGIYVAVAAALIGPLTIVGLALANTIQISSHAMILLVLLVRALGSLPTHKLSVTGAKVGLASAVMALAILVVERWLTPGDSGRFTHLIAVFLPMLVAIAVYSGFMVLLRVEEAGLAWGVLRTRVTGGRTAE
jgi:putative peptidoglycan lipid II flippase